MDRARRRFLPGALLFVLGASLAAADRMETRTCGDSGTPPAGRKYLLRWRTLGRNRDRSRKPPYPEPSVLRLHGEGEPLDVDRVWSGHPVGFCLLTAGELQYVAYYDAQRRMTVAVRARGARTWTRHRLPSKIGRAPRTGRNESSTILGWDSHNFVTMTADADGFLHLSGNMHVNALTYFRQTRRGDVTSFVQEAMTGALEDRCTYPHFMCGPDQELIFHYRHGGSGRGNEIYNVYDPKAKTWSRLLDTPLTDGRGRMNAYFHGPSLGPDGLFHLVWMWRDTPDCRTNHHISYAKSRDLKHWQTAAGKPVALPMTLDSPGVVVDPVPSGAGLINMVQRLGFDSRKRPVVSYHKYDEDGNSQIYNARFEGGRWKVVQASDWAYRWAFAGNGSIIGEIRAGGVRAGEAGTLTQSYRHKKHGAGRFVLDEETLQPMPQ